MFDVVGSVVAAREGTQGLVPLVRQLVHLALCSIMAMAVSDCVRAQRFTAGSKECDERDLEVAGRSREK